MNFIDTITKILFNDKKREQNKLQKGIITNIQNVYAESDSEKEATQNAINAVIEEIQAHPDMPVGEFLKLVQEKTDLSDRGFVEIVKQIPDLKSEKATIEAVENLELPSEAITEIIQDAPVSPVTAQKIAEQIPDKEIQEKQQAEIEKMLEKEQQELALAKEKELLSQLAKIYNDCENLNDNDLVEMIIDLAIDERTEKINESLKHIIAKKIALDCMQFGGPKLPTMMRIMSAVDMLEANIPFLVEKEYNKINTNNNEIEKCHMFSKQAKKMVKEKILENIAKKVAKDFEDIGDISVPQLEQLKNLSEEESNIFIDTVKNSCNEEQLSEDDVIRIKKQLKGETLYEWKDLNRMLEKMKPKDREIAVRDFVQSLKSKNDTKTDAQKKLDRIISDIGIEIRKLPNEKQLSTAKIILETIEQQQEAINLFKRNIKESEEDITNNKEETSKGENR